MSRATKADLERRNRDLEAAYDRLRASHLDLIRFAERAADHMIGVPDLEWSKRIDAETQAVRYTPPWRQT